MTQAIEHKHNRLQQSSEEEITKRHLKFMTYLVELAVKDPEWQADLKQKAENFRAMEQ